MFPQINVAKLLPTQLGISVKQIQPTGLRFMAVDELGSNISKSSVHFVNEMSDTMVKMPYYKYNGRLEIDLLTENENDDISFH